MAKLIIPELPKIAGHQVIERTLFIESTGSAPAGNIINPPKLIFLDLADKVTILEESVGYNGEWDKIIFKDSYGYCKSNALDTLPGTLKSIKPNLDPQYLPDTTAPEIDWNYQDSNTVFEDKKQGKFCIHYDTGVEKLEQINGSAEQSLKNVLYSALISGSSIILQECGKKSDIEYVKKILNESYLFSHAEDFSFILRKCSTLRVLVTIPSKYIFSTDIEQAQVGIFDEFLGDLDPRLKNPDIIIPEVPKKPKNYLLIDFKNYDEYYNFFDDIDDVLYRAQILYGSRKWNLEPKEEINFL